MIYYLLITLFVVVLVLMIIVILLQRARGGGLVGAIGAGGSETALGALGNKEMVKFTTWLAIAFFVLAVLLDFNPPERNSGDLGSIVTTDGKVPSFPEGGNESTEESPAEVEGSAPADEDLLGGALDAGGAPAEDAPVEVDPNAGSQ